MLILASLKYIGSGDIDFIVEVAEGKEPIVLQITDTQIIDASQLRSNERISDTEKTYWAKNKTTERCYNCIREVIEKTKPDLIIHTGDMVYGEFDDEGTSLISFINFMEGFNIPWGPVFGNHDNESIKGVNWQCEKLSNAENCLFRQNNLTGNSNYIVGVRQGIKITRIFIMLDTCGCGNVSLQSLLNGHTTTKTGFGSDQIEWYKEKVKRIKEIYPGVKISFAFHIQPYSFSEAFSKYGFNNKSNEFTPINIDLVENKAQGDFGYIGSVLKSPWDMDKTVWQSIKELEADSVFVGHEHQNSASVIYEGIRCQYGQKSGTYDRANYLQEDGSIIGSYLKAGKPLVGGTAIYLSLNGEIKNAEIILSETDLT